jgi:hypothetical protein
VNGSPFFGEVAVFNVWCERMFRLVSSHGDRDVMVWRMRTKAWVASKSMMCANLMIPLKRYGGGSQSAILADLRTRGEGRKASSCCWLVGSGDTAAVDHTETKVHMPWKGDVHVPQDQVRARCDGVQPTRCSCRSLPRPISTPSRRRCPHDAHKDLAALE